MPRESSLHNPLAGEFLLFSANTAGVTAAEGAVLFASQHYWRAGKNKRNSVHVWENYQPHLLSVLNMCKNDFIWHLSYCSEYFSLNMFLQQKHTVWLHWIWTKSYFSVIIHLTPITNCHVTREIQLEFINGVTSRFYWAREWNQRQQISVHVTGLIVNLYFLLWSNTRNLPKFKVHNNHSVFFTWAIQVLKILLTRFSTGQFLSLFYNCFTLKMLLAAYFNWH